MATKGNLFTQAKIKSPKVDKKNDKPVIPITGKEFDDALVGMAQLEDQIDQITAQYETFKGIVKEFGQKAFEDIYTKTGGYPGSFDVMSDSKASIKMIPMDKYIKCDETRYNDLIDVYGDDVATEKTEFVLNAALVDKYGEILSDLIQNCDDIADDDKAELIQAKTTYTVSKGAIEKAFTWGKGKVGDFIRDIQPIFAMKGAKVLNKS